MLHIVFTDEILPDQRFPGIKLPQRVTRRPEKEKGFSIWKTALKICNDFEGA